MNWIIVFSYFSCYRCLDGLDLFLVSAVQQKFIDNAEFESMIHTSQID